MHTSSSTASSSSLCSGATRGGGGSVETASNTSADDSAGTAAGASSAVTPGADHHADAATKLIINYLPQDMNQDEVRSLFASIGDIESCKLVRDRNTGQSLGYAFVNYLRAEDASRAVASSNGLRLQNKTIKVSLARPSNESIKGANLYISGLPKSIKQSELEAVFRPFGNIITSKILCDTNTGLSRGVGFVRFDRRDEAEYAIERMSGTAPFASCVETIQVKFANNPAAAVQKAISLQMSQAAAAAAAAAQSAILPVSLLQPSTAPQAALTSLNTRKLTSTSGSVGPIHHTPQIGKFRYSPLAGAPMISATAALNNGAALANPMLVAAAAGSYMGNGNVPASFTSPSADLLATNTALLQMVATGGFGGITPQLSVNQLTALASGAGSNTTPIYASQAPSFPAIQQTTLPSALFSAPATGTIVPNVLSGLQTVGMNNTNNGITLFIYNLEPESDDAILWKLFGPFGAVQSVRVMKDLSTNKCKGYGFVTMKNYEEAFAAVTALNGTQLEGRTLQVSFKS